MSGRQLLPRLLQRASRLASANSTQHIAHRPASCSLATRASWLHGDGVATPTSWLGSRSLCTRSVVPSSASMLPLGFRNGVNLAAREVGFTTAGVTYVQVQQRRMLSKLKKTKVKAYSSYKKRFRGMANGEYKRWRSGKRHNAHSKTNKQKRQLRRPSIAPLALAKVMKKLNFMG
ncbi:hypothetical protein M758_10G096100 [Ceratodon purpureus]|nr:hypothetical protein M758_10G096100 [Ceratodon purpureus]KAG0603459.1 hypothetical protein M758_10G096100 [Ceratodon purpureus]